MPHLCKECKECRKPVDPKNHTKLVIKYDGFMWTFLYCKECRERMVLVTLRREKKSKSGIKFDHRNYNGHNEDILESDSAD